MKKTIIAPVGDYMECLYPGIKEFATDKVVLISPKNKLSAAEEAKKDLEKFRINTKIIPIQGELWEETFKAVAEIAKLEGQENVMINVSTGDRNTRCAATSAAFVNGLRAFGVEDDMVMMLPVLKFSYYKILTDKKMEILKVLFKKPKCCSSLDELSKLTKMSLPLISYHINGTLKSEGLKQLGLIETTENKGRVTVSLSSMGRMLVNGYFSAT